VDNADQRNDVLIYIYDLVQRYATRDVSWDDLEEKVEGKFELRKGSLKGKLRTLECHLNESVRIHEEAMKKERKKDQNVDEMVKEMRVIKTRKDELRQSCKGLDTIYKDAKFVTNELGKLLLEEFGSRTRIAGLKNRLKAEKKIANKYSGDETKIRDIS